MVLEEIKDAVWEDAVQSVDTRFCVSLVGEKESEQPVLPGGRRLRFGFSHQPEDQIQQPATHAPRNFIDPLETLMLTVLLS